MRIRGEVIGSRAAFSSGVRLFDGRASTDSRGGRLGVARPRATSAFFFSVLLPLISRFLAFEMAALALGFLACFAALPRLSGFESFAGFRAVAGFDAFADVLALTRFGAFIFVLDGFGAFVIPPCFVCFAVFFCFGFCFGTVSSPQSVNAHTS
jgi:hypothetical protein